jgi:hypothetical protein
MIQDTNLKLNKILIKFFFRYILNILDNSNHKTKIFQTKLLDISKWSQNTIDKEYSRFLKFIYKRYSLSENDILGFFESIFISNVKLMASVFGNIELDIPSFESYWFKALKNIARYFYEQPKILNDDSNVNSIKESLNEILNNVLFKFIPMKKIINIQNTQQNDSFVNFNLDNISGFEKTQESNSHSFQKLIKTNEEYQTLPKESNSHELFYLNDDDDNDINELNEIEISKKEMIEDNESKVINLRSVKPNFIFNPKYSKKKKSSIIDDDINTHFF